MIDNETVRNPQFEATARGLNALAEASWNLERSLGDGSYLRQQKELLDLRRQEAELAKQATRERLRALAQNPGTVGQQAAGLLPNVLRQTLPGGFSQGAFPELLGDWIGKKVGLTGPVGRRPDRPQPPGPGVPSPTPAGSRPNVPERGPGWSGRPVAEPVGLRPPTGTGTGTAAGAGGTGSAAAGAGRAAAAGAGEAGIGQLLSGAAGGPVGLALMVADAAAGKVADGFNKVGRAAETVGVGMQQLANNEHLGMLNTATEAVAGSLEQIPIVGKEYAAAVRAGTAVVNAFSNTVTSYVNRGRELAFASGPISAATARADVRGYVGDVREAQQTGPALARLIEAESKFNSEMRELVLPIKELLINLLARVTEFATTAIEQFKGVGERILGAIQAVGEILRAINIAGFAPLRAAGNALVKLAEDIRSC